MLNAKDFKFNIQCYFGVHISIQFLTLAVLLWTNENARSFARRTLDNLTRQAVWKALPAFLANAQRRLAAVDHLT